MCIRDSYLPNYKEFYCTHCQKHCVKLFEINGKIHSKFECEHTCGGNQTLPYQLLDLTVVKYGTKRISGNPAPFYQDVKDFLTIPELSEKTIENSYNRMFENFKIDKIKKFSKLIGIFEQISMKGGSMYLKIDNKI